MIELDKIYNMNCLDGMKQMEAESVDLSVTSPPYDNLRKYNGYCFDFENIARQLYRVTKQGGVVVWIVGDQTSNGTESGSSFRQALGMMDIGFNLSDTMIWNKINPAPVFSTKRYNQSFDYMFVFVKGLTKTFNPIKVKCKQAGRLFNSYVETRRGNEHKIHRIFKYNETKVDNNVWSINVDKRHNGHPAKFPFELVKRHIFSWSNEGDIILDPFMGSGTTAIVARALRRHYIGFEISEEYCAIAEKELNDYRSLFDL